MERKTAESREARPIAEVVLFKHLDRNFHYAVPEDFRDRLEPGMRVLVPFRNEWLTGIVTRRLRRAEVARVKPILNVLDAAPLLDRPMMALARWLSEYYMTGWGLAMKAILPPGLEAKVGRHYRITKDGREASSGLSGRSDSGRPVLDLLRRSRRGLRLETLRNHLSATSFRGDKLFRALSALVRKGWVEEAKALAAARVSDSAGAVKQDIGADGGLFDLRRNRPAAAGGKSPGVPNELFRAVRSGKFSAVCIEGDEESSRSAVSAAASETIRRGRSVILLVPEIGRVSDWAARLKSEIGASIGVLHSGLSNRERRAQWDAARAGEVSIVVGTRLAVFAPVPNPGLIVVEEEQDPSYKQEEAPRYHARDVAVLRASHHDALALLTAPSPSLETYANLRSGKYQSVRLDDRRSGGRPRPAVRIVQFTDPSQRGFVSDDLLAAVAARLEKKEPVILILNRRGFGTALYCRDCGHVVRCMRCRVAMVYSRERNRLVCHYCGATDAPPTACPGCRGTHLEVLGAGTERAEAYFKARLPAARIARLDRDTTRPQDAAGVIERLNRSDLDIVIGTQLLLNTPRMTRPGLIGLLSAEGTIHLPDFRSGEQMFQLIRRILDYSSGGEVILQTCHPAHEAIAWAATGDPTEFYEKELAQRKAMGYPPFMRLAAVTVKALSEVRAEDAARRLAERLKRLADHPGIQILGPAAAMRPRLRGKYRRQILIKAPDSRILHELLSSGFRAFRTEPGPSGVWFEVDVDPQRIE